MMTFKLTRKPLIAALAGLTVISWMIADSHTSDAQLFRRLRDRIQSRTRAPQIPNNQFQPNVPQPNVPQYNQQQPTDPNNGLDPRRVAPVNPAEPRRTGATETDTDPRLAPRGSASRARRTLPGDQDPNMNPSAFGSSILPRTNANAADAPSPASESAQRKRASLGIQVVESRQGIPGLMVTGINPGSHAPSAGLKVGDLIVSIDGQPTDSVAGISNLLTRRNGGENVQVRIVRDRSTSSIDVPLMGGPLKEGPLKGDTPNPPTNDTIADNPAPEPANTGMLGLRYAKVDGQRGALVTGIQESSPASASGIKTGDRIVAVDDRMLVSAEALQQTLGTRKDDSVIGVRLVRGGKLLSAKIDPLAKPSATDSLASDDSAAADGSKKSVLGSVGAIFGDLLKGKSKPKQPTDEMALGDELELGDEMELGDDEGVEQVDFESDVAAEKKDKSTDPLSLEALEPAPIGEEETVELLPPKQTKKKSPEELQKEIDELRKQIKAFQEKK